MTALVERVELALSAAMLHENTLASQWRECCARYGEESPAALGCLLALVREAWGDDGACPYRYADNPFWGLVIATGTPPQRMSDWALRTKIIRGEHRSLVPFNGASEAGVLVAALEAALEAAP